MDSLKIRKTILSDSLELSGLSQFQGQEVEIIISPLSAPRNSEGTARIPHKNESKSFMRFAGIAATEAPVLEDLEAEILANRDRDLHRQIDL